MGGETMHARDVHMRVVCTCRGHARDTRLVVAATDIGELLSEPLGHLHKQVSKLISVSFSRNRSDTCICVCVCIYGYAYVMHMHVISVSFSPEPVEHLPYCGGCMCSGREVRQLDLAVISLSPPPTAYRHAHVHTHACHICTICATGHTPACAQAAR